MSMIIPSGGPAYNSSGMDGVLPYSVSGGRIDTFLLSIPFHMYAADIMSKGISDISWSILGKTSWLDIARGLAITTVVTRNIFGALFRRRTGSHCGQSV